MPGTFAELQRHTDSGRAVRDLIVHDIEANGALYRDHGPSVRGGFSRSSAGRTSTSIAKANTAHRRSGGPDLLGHCNFFCSKR